MGRPFGTGSSVAAWLPRTHVTVVASAHGARSRPPSPWPPRSSASRSSLPARRLRAPRRSRRTAGRSSRSTASTRSAPSSATRASGRPRRQPLLPFRGRHLVPGRNTGLRDDHRPRVHLASLPTGGVRSQTTATQFGYWHIRPAIHTARMSPPTARSSARSWPPGSTCISRSIATACMSTRSGRERSGRSATRRGPGSRRSVSTSPGARCRAVAPTARRPHGRSLRRDPDSCLGALGRQAGDACPRPVAPRDIPAWSPGLANPDRPPPGEARRCCVHDRTRAGRGRTSAAGRAGTASSWPRTGTRERSRTASISSRSPPPT